MKRESAYKREKVAKYGSECSEIIPSFLYVGGNGVAEDFGYFTAHGITHVVNCAGYTVQNYHADKHITYMTLDMLDDGLQVDLTWFLHLVFDFIEHTWEHGGRVFIHCARGVSRSCAFCVAFVMWRNALEYRQAYELIRRRRLLCQPNMGFAAQLMAWARRRGSLWDANERRRQAQRSEANIGLTHATLDQPTESRSNHPGTFRELLYRVSLTHAICVSKLCYCSQRDLLPPSSRHMDPCEAFIIVTRVLTIAWIGQWCPNILRTYARHFACWMRMSI